ncbi:hypothetical protein ACHAXR_005305 [Thalassiosira sp. AJA248-18]
MDELRLTILGFGSANRALVRMLLEKSEPSPGTNTPWRHLRIPIGSSRDTRLVRWRVVCIITRRHGRVCVPLSNETYEIDLETALTSIESGRMLGDDLVVQKQTPAGKANNISSPDHNQHIVADTLTDTEQTINNLGLLGDSQTSNIVVEAIPSNPKGDGEPAISFITKAIKSKMHVVSANKSPLAHCNNENEETYWAMQQLAQNNNIMYQHESAVMDGVPIFSLWKHTMPHATLTSIRGCLNSTTTMILTRMEGNLDEENKINNNNDGESFQEALDAAKQMGIVEEDESLDIDGYDAAVKLRALLVVLTEFNQNIRVPTMNEIRRDTIRNVTREDIHRAYANGRKKYRLVASAKLIDLPLSSNDEIQGLPKSNNTSTNVKLPKRWEASVQLQCLPPSDPLYNLSGTDASVTFGTDVLGPVTVVSSNPTLVDTAYGLFSDIVRVASKSM